MKGPTSMALGPQALSSWALCKEGQEPPFCWLTARREHDVPQGMALCNHVGWVPCHRQKEVRSQSERAHP